MNRHAVTKQLVCYIKLSTTAHSDKIRCGRDEKQSKISTKARQDFKERLDIDTLSTSICITVSGVTGQTKGTSLDPKSSQLLCSLSGEVAYVLKSFSRSLFLLWIMLEYIWS